MTDRKAKVEELVENFAALKRTMARRGGAMRTPHITPSQWEALMLIERRGTVSVKDIASSLRVSSSAATQLVDGLVKSGYVLRKESAQDRRAVVVSASKKAKSRVAKMKGELARKFLVMFKALNDREFEQYCALNKKIINGISKH